VFVQQEIYGMEQHVLILVMQEESLIQLVNNVSVHQVTGMETHVLSVKILKFGVYQGKHVVVNKETGMD
jgi:hypothetical protein